MPVLPNARHERFAQELAKGKTADEAYQLAGFKPNRGNATRLKANESVVKRLEELQGAIAEKAVVDAAWVLEKLVENVDRAMQVSEVIVDGKQTGEYKYEGNVANRALELVGKHVAVQAFRDRIEHTGKDGGPVQVKSTSDVAVALAAILAGAATSSE